MDIWTLAKVANQRDFPTGPKTRNVLLILIFELRGVNRVRTWPTDPSTHGWTEEKKASHQAGRTGEGERRPGSVMFRP